MKTLTITLIFIGLTSAKAQTFNPKLAAMLQDTLNFYVSAITSVKGMSASVYIPGQGIWKGTAGVSYAGQPITEDMRFGIASNSKLFVAVGMLKLAENNILSLDDAVSKWLPAYNNVNPNITIRQLLNHTSGIMDPIFTAPYMDTVKAYPNRIFTEDEVLSWLGAPLFAPGGGYSYSNINYILSGMIAEKATGIHIAKIIRDSILDPLNMDSTFYDFQEPAIGTIAHRWWDLVDYNDTSRVGLNSAGGCAGSMFSTASEMAQWYKALFGGEVINANSMAELTDFLPTTNPNSDYGLGLARETTQNLTYYGHGGTTWGYRSKMMYDTCLNVAVCGLTNSFPSGMDAVTFLLYRAIVNHVPGCADPIAGNAVFCQGETGITFSVPAMARATSYEWILPSGATGFSNTNTITVDFGANAVSGEIIVRGVNDYGAGGSSSLFVTVNPIPATPVVSFAADVLTSDAANGNQWYNSTGAIAGATGQSYTITATDDYYCIVTLAGCVSDTSNIVHAQLSDLNENGMERICHIYPNPVKDVLTIDVRESGQSLPYAILNATGQQIATGTATQKSTFDTASLAPGIYLLQLQHATGTSVYRFMKQ